MSNVGGIADVNPWRYRGYYFDTESGLYYLNSRYYDPVVGRFLNADDVDYLEPTSINGLNLYAYCMNNPVNMIDSTGTFAITLSFLIGLGVAALTFATVNTAAQFVSDCINYAFSGTWESGWEDYLGAFIGGLAGGATFFLTHGNLAATYAVMGGVQTLSTNLMTNATGKTDYNGWQILGNTALSAGIGFVSGKLFGGTKVSGVTAGRNSFMAIWKGGLTRLRNSTGRMAFKTMAKGLAGVSVLRIGAAVIGGVTSSLMEFLDYLFGGN